MFTEMMMSGSGGGTPHIECACAKSSQYYYDRSVISTDGTIYLGNYNSSTSIRILQACKARIRAYNGSDVTERDVDVGEVIGNGNTVMLIDTSTI